MTINPLKILIFTAFVATFLMATPPMAAGMCSCTVDPVLSAERGAHVYIVTATRVEFLDSLRDDSREPRIIADFDVQASWTDSLFGTIRLHTVYNKMGCRGYWFREGGRYLFVVTSNPPPEQPDRAASDWPPPGTYGV